MFHLIFKSETEVLDRLKNNKKVMFKTLFQFFKAKSNLEESGSLNFYFQGWGFLLSRIGQPHPWKWRSFSLSRVVLPRLQLSTFKYNTSPSKLPKHLDKQSHHWPVLHVKHWSNRVRMSHIAIKKIHYLEDYLKNQTSFAEMKLVKTSEND